MAERASDPSSGASAWSAEPALDRALDQLATTPVLLAATNVDGTIAEIVERPEDARPLAEAVGALEILAELRRTHVALVSGRALDSLRGLAGMPTQLRVVASHGVEDGSGMPLELTAAEQHRLQRVRELALALATPVPGCRVEDKPAGVAFHYRSADQAAGLQAVRAYAEALSAMPNVEVRSGKAVLEASVRSASKGRALVRLRAEVGATTVLYAGDDDTDEGAFDALAGTGVTVKVGEGRTSAALRVPDPPAVATFLARLAARRRACQ